jgi:hypothetical protein
VVGLGGKLWPISQDLARWVYSNARINHARARTRWDLGSYRLGSVEDIYFIVFEKRISTLEYGGWSWLKTLANFPGFGQLGL